MWTSQTRSVFSTRKRCWHVIRIRALIDIIMILKNLLQDLREFQNSYLTNVKIVWKFSFQDKAVWWLVWKLIEKNSFLDQGLNPDHQLYALALYHWAIQDKHQSMTELISYMKCVGKMSPILFHIENTFIGSECYIDGKAGLSAVFRPNHCCDWCTFACVVAFFVYPCHLVIVQSCRVAQVQGSVCTARELSHTDFQAFLAPLLQLFKPKPKAD